MFSTIFNKGTKLVERISKLQTAIFQKAVENNVQPSRDFAQVLAGQTWQGLRGWAWDLQAPQ